MKGKTGGFYTEDEPKGKEKASDLLRWTVRR
jgi:hypothetical protein